MNHSSQHEVVRYVSSRNLYQMLLYRHLESVNDASRVRGITPALSLLSAHVNIPDDPSRRGGMRELRTAAPGIAVCPESILASPDMAHLGALVGRCWTEEQSAGLLPRQYRSAPSWVANIAYMSAACALWPAFRSLPIQLILQISIPLMSPLAHLQLIALIAVQVGTVGRTHAPWWNWQPRLACAERASLAVDPTGLDLRAQDGSSKVCRPTCTPSNLEHMEISHQLRGQWAQCAQIPHQGAIGIPRGQDPGGGKIPRRVAYTPQKIIAQLRAIAW